MSVEGYMTEEEFKQAIQRAALEICGNINGPLSLKNSVIKTAPPQSYCGIPIKTYDDILKHIARLYYANTSCHWWPSHGPEIKYDDICSGKNFPQKITHPVLGEAVYHNVMEMTVRRMGCTIFCNTPLPQWLSGILIFTSKKYSNIMTSIKVKPISADEEKDMLKWKEPSSSASKTLGPTDENFIELWRLATKRRIADYNVQCEKHVGIVKRQLEDLAAEMIAYLEKIPFKPKYGEWTNCADVPIMAMPE
jgi:hypothetical protein